MGAEQNGRLIFTSAVAGVTLLADPDLTGLVCGDFSSRLSWIGMEPGVVALSFRTGQDELPPSHPAGSRHATVRLNARIPWALEFRGAVAALQVRLGGLALQSLDVLGPATSVLLELPRPTATTYLYFASATALVTLRRPPGTFIGINTEAEMKGLSLDGKQQLILDPGERIESGGCSRTANRFEISLSGPGSQWRIDDSLYGADGSAPAAPR